jgi:hypothetical protein
VINVTSAVDCLKYSMAQMMRNSGSEVGSPSPNTTR